MLSTLNTSAKLYLLIFITAASLIGLGLYGIGDLKEMNDNTKSLYSDRVLCIQQLSSIRFEYDTEILPIAQGIRNHTLTFAQAKERILKAEEIIDTNWRSYKLTYLTPKERLLVKQTDAIKNQAYKAVENLLLVLSKNDTASLDQLIQKGTFAEPAPFALKINQLLDLQVRVAKEILNNNKTLYRVTTTNFIFFIVLALAIALSLSFYIIKNIKNLIKDVFKSNTIIKESEEKYRRLIETACDAIYVLDLKGNFTDANEIMCHMTGYSKEELLHLNIERVVDPEQLKTDPLVHGYNHRGKSLIKERRFISKDGKLLEVEINVNMFADNQVLVIARDITDRKRMEADIKEAELKFRTLVEKSMVGVYIVQNGRFVYVNPRFAAIFGYAPEELINSFPVETIIHNSYSEIASEHVRRRTTGEIESIHYEAMGQKKDGTTNWVEFYGSTAVIGDKSTIIGSMIDITERKVAEELILKEKALSETIINSLPGVFYLQSATGQFLLWNKNFETIIGYSREEIVKLRTGDLIVEEDREKVMDTIKKLFIEGYATVEATAKTKNGVRIPFLLTGSPIMYENQLCLLGTGIDISLRIKAEESLKKSEANLKTIMDTTDIAYTLLDKELNVLAYNPMAIKFVNSQFRKTPVKGDRLVDYFPKERFPQFLKYTGQVLKGENIHYEINYKQPDESVLWYDVRLFPITNNQNEIFGLMIALSDVTERKMSEIHLEELNENLKKHAKELAISNAELEQFAYVASHDLQEPLRMVTSFLTQLEKKYSDMVDAKGKQYIYFAVDGAKRMRQIILDLLDFSRVGRTEDDLEEVNFNKLVNEILGLYRRQIEELKASIIFENLPTLQTYKTPVRQVFQNLIGNSLKYHKANEAPVISITCKETKTHFQFSIKDNGIGIATEYFDRVFIIFQRLHNKDEYSGTGMGLAITKKIIETLGGKIWLESEEGKGSTFYFTMLKNNKI
jgi:two-component system, sporulation sensor kinase E